MSDKYDKWEATIIKRYGSLEAYKEQAREYGYKGGKTGGNGLHTLSREQLSEAGKKGHQAMIENLKKRLRGEIDEG